VNDRVQVTVSTPIARSGRVMQLAGMFDVPIEQRQTLSWDLSLPLGAKPWQVGLIVGPSGSGKSTIAREIWPDQVASAPSWRNHAIVDDFDESLGIKEIAGALNAVGLSSPPAWLRPYRTLSNGERFRADMARLLSGPDPVVVVDEFTSVVDRQVAKVASHALQKTIRRGTQQFVAVTCHYDVLDWLQPDWVLDLATSEFSWRSVQPHPPVELAVARVGAEAWRMFHRHHYLSADLHKAAQCYGGWIGDDLVAFAAYIHFPHAHVKDIKMAHRVVVLPDYQGLGLGMRLNDWIGQQLAEQGYRYRYVVSHPAVIAYCRRSPRWQATHSRQKQLQTATSTDKHLKPHNLDPRRLSLHSFQYRPVAGTAAKIAERKAVR
jgi:ABC-type ATPase involved in cell division/GNAT superfamily N-acetyltransferase